MAPHSSTLAWRIPWMEEPGRLQSMGSRRVRRDWATLLSLFIFRYWRRKQQPTPVFLLVESQGRGSLVGCCLWGLTESDTPDGLAAAAAAAKSLTFPLLPLPHFFIPVNSVSITIFYHIFYISTFIPYCLFLSLWVTFLIFQFTDSFSSSVESTV